jgi:hypothetical protein
MPDVYASLSPTAQTEVRARLFAVVQSNPCPTVDLAGITTAAALADAGTRALAVDCFQASQQNLSSPAGVLDQATYSALVGWWPALPMWEKGAVVAGGGLAAYLAYRGIKRMKRTRRLARR